MMARLSPTLRLALADLAGLAATDPETFCEGVYALKDSLEKVASTVGPFASAARRALPGLSEAVHEYACAADALAEEPELPFLAEAA